MTGWARLEFRKTAGDVISARPRQALGSRGNVEASAPRPRCLGGLGGSKEIKIPPVLHPLSHRGSECRWGWKVWHQIFERAAVGDSGRGTPHLRAGGRQLVYKASSPLPTPTPEYLASLGTRAGWPPLFLPLSSPGPGLCPALSLASWPLSIWPLLTHLALGKGQGLCKWGFGIPRTGCQRLEREHRAGLIRLSYIHTVPALRKGQECAVRAANPYSGLCARHGLCAFSVSTHLLFTATRACPTLLFYRLGDWGHREDK